MDNNPVLRICAAELGERGKASVLWHSSPPLAWSEPYDAYRIRVFVWRPRTRRHTRAVLLDKVRRRIVEEHAAEFARLHGVRVHVSVLWDERQAKGGTL